MTRSKYPRSIAKHIRTQKGLIRKQTQDKEEQDKLIREVINRVGGSRAAK